LDVRTGEQLPVCEVCGQVLQPQPEPRVLQVHAGTIVNAYEVWPIGQHNKPIGPRVLVVEVERQVVKREGGAR
jgi:hypothetical protein